MGYALFANRKIYYTDLVFSLQQKLDAISIQRQSILTLSANISDGMVTAEEIAGDASNFNNYYDFMAGYSQWAEESGAAEADGQIKGMAAEQNDDEAHMLEISEMIGKAFSEKYAEQYAKKLQVAEHKLEMEQKKIESQLTVAQQELQAVEQAEAQAIQNATPKYAGLG